MAVVSDIEIRLRADIARLQTDMNAARRSVDGAMGGITQAANSARNALMSIGAGLGAGALASMVDQYVKFTSQLKLATQSQREYNTAYADVKRIAAGSAQGLQETGVLYARIANGVRELGVSQKQVAAITETVNLSLLVSGATANEAASAQLQLSQAFASGTLRGEEFNAVNEAAPRLMKALADGIGVPVGALKKMAEEGLITSEIMANVLPNALVTLREEAKNIQTISGAFTLLKNNAIEFVGSTAQASGAVTAISTVLSALANNLTLVAGALLTVVAVKIANFLDAAIVRTRAAVVANNTLVASNLAVAKAEATAAAQTLLHTNARLAEIRAATLAATGNVQLALTMNALIPAQARATAASLAMSSAYYGLGAAQSAAALGTRALNAALAFTGGPIGLIVTALGVAATAWGFYESSQAKANEKAAADTKESASEMTENLAKVNEMLRERARLQSAGAGEAVTGDDPRSQELRDTLREINDLKARGAALDASDQIRLISLQGIYNGLNKEMTDNINLRREQEANGQAAKALVSVRERLTGINGQYLKELGLLQTALAKGAIGQAEYTDLVSRLAKETYAASDAGKAGAEAAKKSEQAAKDAGRAAKEQAKEYADLISTLTGRVEVTAREAAGLTKLTQAEEAALDLTERLRLGKIKLTAAQEAAARSLIQEAGANDVLAASRAADEKLQQQLANNMRDLAAEREGLIQSARAEAEQNELAVKTFGMTEDAIIRLNAARLLEQETQRLGRSLTEDEITDLQRVIELKERSAQAVAARAELEAAKTFWTDIEKTAHDTFVSIADGGKNAFQRLKDTAKNTFFDWLYQQTLKKWIINIGTSSSGGGVSSLAQAFGGSSEGGLGGVSNLISIGKTIYSGFSTGLAGSLGSTISSLGSMFGSQAVSAFGAGVTGSSLGASTALGSSGYAGTAAAGAGASAGAYAIPIAGWIAAGMTVANNLYKQGWDATNGTLNTAGKVFGSSILAFNSVLKKIGLSSTAANIFSGQATISKLFGRKNPEIERQGIEGTFDAEGFTGKAFADILEKGGWFRSDKRYQKLADLDAAQQNSFDATITGMILAVKGFGGVLGAETSAVDSYSKAIKLTFGKDEAENQKMITDLFAGIGDELAVKLLPNITKFQQEGESAAATLQRLATNFAAVDIILDALGTNSETAFRAVGVASIEARERIVALTGGLEAFAAQTEFFNQNFLSEAEQIAIIQKPLQEQLAALGYAGITTTEQFKTAVQTLASSGRLATEEGAKTFAGLLAIAPQFKTVADYLKELGDAAAETAKNAKDAADALLSQNEATLRGAVDSAFAAVGRAVEAMREKVTTAYATTMQRLGASIERVTARVSDLTRLSDALRGAITTVESDAQGAASRGAARAQVQAAIAIAKASGVLPSVEDLAGALSTLQKDSGDQFSSLVDYQREVARTNLELQTLGALTDKQLTDAQRQLAVLEDQKALAERQYADEMARLDGVLEWAQAEVDAINGVRTDVQSVVAAIAGLNVAIQALRQGATPSNPKGGALSLTDLYATVLGRTPDAAGYEFWQKAYGDMIDSAEYADFIKAAQPELEAQARLNQPPIGYVAPQSSTMLANADQQQINDRMERQLASIAASTEKFASQFENVSGGGQSIFVENVN